MTKKRRSTFLRLLQFLLVGLLFWEARGIYDYYKKTKNFDAKHEAYRAELASLEEEAAHGETDEEDPEASASTEAPEPETTESQPAESQHQENKKPTPRVRILRLLKARHPQVLGRLIVPGTDIDYPVVQGEDNDFYLDHDYLGNPDDFGAIFLDAAHAPDFSELNTVLYGHNVRAGKMFDPLRGYLDDPDFLNEHPTVLLVTPEEEREYRVFACYLTAKDAAFRRPDYSAEDWELFGNFVGQLNVLDVPEDERPVWGRDRVLTLSSCNTVDDRLVVQAFMREEEGEMRQDAPDPTDSRQ